MVNLFLEDSELRELTGYKARSSQAKWLQREGFRFHRNRLGRVLVLRSHVETVMGGNGVAKPREPNYEYLVANNKARVHG